MREKDMDFGIKLAALRVADRLRGPRTNLITSDDAIHMDAMGRIWVKARIAVSTEQISELIPTPPDGVPERRRMQRRTGRHERRLTTSKRKFGRGGNDARCGERRTGSDRRVTNVVDIRGENLWRAAERMGIMEYEHPDPGDRWWGWMRKVFGG